MTPNDLLKINVNDHTEKKNGLTYLSWAWAWAEALKADPAATFEVKSFNYDGAILPFMAMNGTAMVWVTVTMFGKAMTCFLPVMDHRNKPIASPDSFQVNTAIMRCMVKGLALHGLGLYIYAGEDLPQAHKPDRKPDPILSQMLHACENIDELRAAWKSMTPDQREAHGDVLAEVKERMA